MNNMENNELFDLGSAPVSDDFDPFAMDEELDAGTTEGISVEQEETMPQQVQEETPILEETGTEAAPDIPASTEEEPAVDASDDAKAEKVADIAANTKVETVADAVVNTKEESVSGIPVSAGDGSAVKSSDVSASGNTSVPESKPAKNTKAETDFEEKPPVFAYAGATETIGDTSMTFDELRIEKAGDFPELDDGKRVSWTVEYGKITKNVPDPKGTSIGKMKSDIESSKEFRDSLKRAKDKNPVCKIKPRVTAQSKGTVTAYKGVFPTVEEAEAAGKVISIVPSRDGRVYEIRDTEMGRFATPVSGCELLSDVQAGFTPALPRIPAEIMMQVLAFFRHFVQDGCENEALLNIYWDKEAQEFIVDAPEQVVTKISVDSQISEKLSGDRYIHYMDIHSHNTMGAFFSP
ncbi:MAG: hypothetical protein NC389_17955, partial [Acetatifactor muris]|nr:hypothetical protein [Acetatifactor muris]